MQGDSIGTLIKIAGMIMCGLATAEVVYMAYKSVKNSTPHPPEKKPDQKHHEPLHIVKKQLG